MRGRGVREGLVERIEEILRETSCRVRIGGDEGEEFCTARGVRQGCPMSPILFNLVLADLGEELRKVKWGGTRIGEERVYSLLYADDMVLIVKKEEEMKSMLERLEGYRDKKGLEINIEKTKIVRFDRGRGEEKE